MILRALSRTVLADPRPALGFLSTQVLSTLVLGVVLAGGTALARVDPRVDAVIESIVQLTALSAIIASFVSGRAIAMSLRPETRSLEALGAGKAPLVAFGALVVVTGAVPALVLSAIASGPMTTLWVDGIGRVVDVDLPPQQGSPSIVASCLVTATVACFVGWWRGLVDRGSPGHSGRTRRIWFAVAVVTVFLVPTVLAVTLAPHLVDTVRKAGEAAAAGRLGALGSADAPVVVMAAAAYGFVAAAMVLAPDLARTIIATVQWSLDRTWLSASVGLRLAEARLAQFGAIATLCVGAVGLVATQTMTAAVSEHIGSARAGAALDELAFTLGPSLLVAAAGASGVCLAQSRGTGSDLAKLARLGCSAARIGAVLATAALAVGGSGAFIGIGAAAAVALVAIVSGVDVASFALMDLTAPITAVGLATSGCVCIFVCSEVFGSYLSRRGRQERIRLFRE